MGEKKIHKTIEVYEQLANRLDQLPNRFPITPSGIEDGAFSGPTRRFTSGSVSHS